MFFSEMREYSEIDVYIFVIYIIWLYLISEMACKLLFYYVGIMKNDKNGNINEKEVPLT